jgi:hypothetical protein
MGTGTGMRATDLQKFLIVARQHGVTLLVRHTNADSLRYVGRAGYYPKPAFVKAKTADQNPPPLLQSVQGRIVGRSHDIAGLVVHPGMHPGAFKGSKHAKAMAAWNDGLHVLSAGALPSGNPTQPDSWAAWGVARPVAASGAWRWRVDVDPESPHYGCLQIAGGGVDWSYIHGDYDLKDVIVAGRESDNRRQEGQVHGVKNYTPLLDGVEFERIRRQLNTLIGADMVQHGAEAQFAWHGDEPITVAKPDFTHLLLLDAPTVQRWYLDLNRSVLAKAGQDYLADRSRMFHFGPQGMFAPGKEPNGSWG